MTVIRNEIFKVLGTEYITNGITDYEKCLALWINFIEKSLDYDNLRGIDFVKQFQFDVVCEYGKHIYGNDYMESPDLYLLLLDLAYDNNNIKLLLSPSLLKPKNIIKHIGLCFDLLRTVQDTVR